MSLDKLPLKHRNQIGTYHQMGLWFAGFINRRIRPVIADAENDNPPTNLN